MKIYNLTASSFGILLAFLFICTLPAMSRMQGGNGPSSSALKNNSDNLFQIGEELVYNVSYAGFDIGQVKVKLQEKVQKGQIMIYKATAFIDSYKGVPFVDLHSVFESDIDEKVFTHLFHARDKDDDKWKSYIYNFDYQGNRVFLEEGTWKSGVVDKRDTIKIDTLYQDGLSLFFFARQQVLTKHKSDVPVLVNEKKGSTFIDFTGTRASQEIDAVDYPVDVLYFNGKAGFIGIFGLTGGFEGWFSNDDARVPILAKMKVLIGNIRIELMSWKRNEWAPPKFVK